MLRSLGIAIAIATISIGCGLEVDITPMPNPARTGKPLDLKVTVLNDETCVLDSVDVCILPLGDLTFEQREMKARVQEAMEAGTLGQLALEQPGMMTQESLCGLEIIPAEMLAVELPANGVTCSPSTNGQPIECNLGALGPGQSKMFTVTVVPTESGRFDAIAFAFGKPAVDSNCVNQNPFGGDIADIVVTDEGVMAPVASAAALGILLVALAALGFRHTRRKARDFS